MSLSHHDAKLIPVLKELSPDTIGILLQIAFSKKEVDTARLILLWALENKITKILEDCFEYVNSESILNALMNESSPLSNALVDQWKKLPVPESKGSYIIKPLWDLHYLIKHNNYVLIKELLQTPEGKKQLTFIDSHSRTPLEDAFSDKIARELVLDCILIDNALFKECNSFLRKYLKTIRGKEFIDIFKYSIEKKAINFLMLMRAANPELYTDNESELLDLAAKQGILTYYLIQQHKTSSLSSFDMFSYYINCVDGDKHIARLLTNTTRLSLSEFII